MFIESYYGRLKFGFPEMPLIPACTALIWFKSIMCYFIFAGTGDTLKLPYKFTYGRAFTLAGLKLLLNVLDMFLSRDCCICFSCWLYISW